MKICRVCVMMLSFSFPISFVDSIDAQVFQATITGTVETGEFNQNDLAGTEFIFTALIFDLTDYSSNDLVGSFVAQSATFEFGGTELGPFVANENQLGFVYTNDNAGGFFQVAFTSDVELITDAQGYSTFFNPPIFDPNSLMEIPLFEDFDDPAQNGRRSHQTAQPAADR